MAAGTAIPRSTTGLAKVGITAAIVTGVALLLKVAVIVATSNTVDLVPAILYIVGMLTALVAAVGIASMVRGGVARKVVAGVGIVLLHALYIMMLSDGVGALVAPFTDAEYLTEEIPIAVAGLVWLLVGVALRRRQTSDERF